MTTNNLVPLHWCHDVRPCSETVLYTEEGPVLIHPYLSPHSNNQNTTKMQPQTAYLIFVHMILMLTPTTNSSRMELGESVIFQPVLQAYPT